MKTLSWNELCIENTAVSIAQGGDERIFCKISARNPSWMLQSIANRCIERIEDVLYFWNEETKQDRVAMLCISEGVAHAARQYVTTRD